MPSLTVSAFDVERVGPLLTLFFPESSRRPCSWHVQEIDAVCWNDKQRLSQTTSHLQDLFDDFFQLANFAVALPAQGTQKYDIGSPISLCTQLAGHRGGLAPGLR